MIGTLKASNAQLEHEKSQLAGQVAELQTENRRLENRLAEEEVTNGELHARLDNARNLISRQGLDSSQADSLEAAAPRAPRTTPAGRTPRKGRKTPFAQIPGELNAVPHPDDEREFDSNDEPRTRRSNQDFGPQTRLDRPRRWLPIANGVSSSSQVR
jgi:hypothetical protein